MSLDGGLMGLFGLGLNAAGTAASSYAAYRQAKAEQAAANWNAGMLEGNAGIRDLLAGQALEKGKHDIAVAKREGALAIERQRGAYAASGIRVDTGSALDVVAEQAGRNRYDQDMLEYNAKLAAWGHTVEAANLRQQAAMTRVAGKSSGPSLATSLLNGGTNLFNNYQQYQRSFAD